MGAPQDKSRGQPMPEFTDETNRAGQPLRPRALTQDIIDRRQRRRLRDSIGCRTVCSPTSTRCQAAHHELPPGPEDMDRSVARSHRRSLQDLACGRVMASCVIGDSLGRVSRCARDHLPADASHASATIQALVREVSSRSSEGLFREESCHVWDRTLERILIRVAARCLRQTLPVFAQTRVQEVDLQLCDVRERSLMKWFSLDSLDWLRLRELLDTSRPKPTPETSIRRVQVAETSSCAQQ